MQQGAGRAVPCAPRKSSKAPGSQDGTPGARPSAFTSAPERLTSGPVRAVLNPPARAGTPSLLAQGLWLLLVAVALVGCKSVLVSAYISPRVTGRVLAADTRQPLAGVKIQRVKPSAGQDYDATPRGGQRMGAMTGIRTDQQGRFVLEAERDLTLIQQQFWYSVTVSFQREGYLTLQTNFTATSATNTPDGTPVVNAGDILLHPVSP